MKMIDKKWGIGLLMACLGILINSFAIAQQKPVVGFNKNYVFLHSDNLTADKDFYLLTVIDHTPEVKKLISNDNYLKQVLTARVTLLKNHVSDTCITPLSMV